MKNKNLLIGGAVVAGLLFFYFRNRQTDNGELRASDSDLGGGGGAMAQENGGGAVMQTGQPVVVAQPKRKPPRQSSIPRFNNPEDKLAWLKINRPDLLPNFNPSTQASSNLPANIQEAIDRAKGNFLTFSGDVENPSNLDFGGNIID
jgi:hypothetical protein